MELKTVQVRYNIYIMADELKTFKHYMKGRIKRTLKHPSKVETIQTKKFIKTRA